MHGHQCNLSRFIVIFVSIAVRRNPFQKFFQSGFFIGCSLFLFKIVNERFKVQQVFDAALSLQSVFILKDLKVACLHQKIVINIRNSQVVLFLLA